VTKFLVVGLGNFGATAALSLRETGHDVTALDIDPARVERVASLLQNAVIGDGTRADVLDRIEANEIEEAIVSTGHDITASILTAVGLRDFGIRDVHVKVVSDLHARIVEKLGVAEPIFPERESARLLARRLTSRKILNYVELGPGLCAQELAVPDQWVGRTLRELELPRRYRISVIAVRDYLTDSTAPIPDPDAPLKESDTLFLAGRVEDLERVTAIS
jgi:trk system potassium uptake protein TrkA